MVFILPVVAEKRSNATETMSQEEREQILEEQKRAVRAHQLLQNKMVSVVLPALQTKSCDTTVNLEYMHFIGKLLLYTLYGCRSLLRF